MIHSVCSESMQARGGWLPVELGFGLTEGGWAGAEAGMACEEHFAEIALGEVTRYELPKIGALNFVLSNALGGGVTRPGPRGKPPGLQATGGHPGFQGLAPPP